MSLSPVYDPSLYEDKIYKKWEDTNAFAPNFNSNKESFSVVMPPPNANGNLHIGHALTISIQDIIIRFQRMRGKVTLYLPGADHAGFETQVVYEKELAKQGKSRFDFNREELYSKIWDFVDQNKDNYQTQFRKLGASVDWNYFTYTLDKKIINRTNDTFKKMWDDGLVYRGERLVNFCTFHGTAFADIEVDHKDIEGNLWEITYPLTDGSGEVTVATTRPETMLGDTAVAVHPKDKKLTKFIGKTVKLPLTKREIPIIADDMVDTTFGTGAVKITPSHDSNDFEVSKRHDLPLISVIGHDGLMTNEAGENYRGLTVIEARKKVLQDLKEANFIKKVTPIKHSVGHCYKCGTIIQPLLREQWFVDMKPLSTKAIATLKQGQIKFYPSQKLTQLITYLEGLHDWNISRQIAWGIPIPAFQNSEDPEEWIFDTRTDQETIEVGNKTYYRDPDVFDTWFSSGQWPFATLDYPDSKIFKQFYPLSLMETGFDIMNSWVARMIMLGLYITNDIPFKKVYLHGMVLDEHGAKMSKSKGNVVNPMDVVAKYGSDALRMGLITGQTAGNNQPFTTAKVVGARNFCNKLWNIARFIEGEAEQRTSKSPTPETIADHWALSVLQHSTLKITSLLKEFRISEAYDLLYHMVWDQIADWHIEASKHGAGHGMLEYILVTILKLAHPFAPFVTEAIYQTIKPNELLASTQWPEIISYNTTKANEFTKIIKIVTEVRQLTKNLKLSKPVLYFEKSNLLKDNALLIAKLTNINKLEQRSNPVGIRLISTLAYLETDQKHLQDYQNELGSKIKQTTTIISNLEKRIANKAYIAQAPKNVVQQTKDQLVQAKTDLNLLKIDQKRFKL